MADCFCFNISLGGAKHLHSTPQSSGRHLKHDGISPLTPHPWHPWLISTEYQSSQSSNRKPSWLNRHLSSYHCSIISCFTKQDWERSVGQHVEKTRHPPNWLVKMMLLIWKNKNKNHAKVASENKMCAQRVTVTNAHVLQIYYWIGSNTGLLKIQSVQWLHHRAVVRFVFMCCGNINNSDSDADSLRRKFSSQHFSSIFGGFLFWQ